MANNEIWKDIEGYEGSYQVSNLGRVKSLSRVIKWSNSYRRVKEKIRSLSKGKEGYLYITLPNSTHTVHRLVAKAFLNTDNISDKEVNHKNSNRSDNNVSNLEWLTHSQNVQDAKNKGNYKNRVHLIGSNNHNSKLDEKNVENIRKLSTLFSSLELAHIYSVNKSTINRVLNNKTWHRKG